MGGFIKGMAKVLMKRFGALFKLMFVEEPVLTENEEAFVELQRGIPPPHRYGGEGIIPEWGFKTSILTRGGVDIIQPDPSLRGIPWKPERLQLWQRPMI